MTAEPFAILVRECGRSRLVGAEDLEAARLTLGAELLARAKAESVLPAATLERVIAADAAAALPGETIQCGNALFSIVRKSGLDYI